MEIDDLLEAMKRAFRTQYLADLDEHIARNAFHVMGGHRGATVVPAKDLAARLGNLGADLTALAGELTGREDNAMTDEEYREKAREEHGKDGEIELEEDAEVSRPDMDEDGAYVQAWVWVAAR